MQYLKVWTSFRELLEPLTDAERGRLFVAMLEYAESGAEPQLSGSERYVWPSARQSINNTRDKSEQMKANGSRSRQIEANPSKPEQTRAAHSIKKKITIMINECLRTLKNRARARARRRTEASTRSGRLIPYTKPRPGPTRNLPRSARTQGCWRSSCWLSRGRKNGVTGGAGIFRPRPTGCASAGGRTRRSLSCWRRGRRARAPRLITASGSMTRRRWRGGWPWTTDMGVRSQ